LLAAILVSAHHYEKIDAASRNGAVRISIVLQLLLISRLESPGITGEAIYAF
jgi:hypothetical protein